MDGQDFSLKQERCAEKLSICLEKGVGRALPTEWTYDELSDHFQRLVEALEGGEKKALEGSRQRKSKSLPSETIRSAAGKRRRKISSGVGKKLFYAFTRIEARGEKRAALLGFYRSYIAAYPDHSREDITLWVREMTTEANPGATVPPVTDRNTETDTSMPPVETFAGEPGRHSSGTVVTVYLTISDSPTLTENSWPGPITLFISVIGISLILLNYQNTNWIYIFGSFSLVMSLFTWLFEVSLRKQDAKDQVAKYFQQERYADVYRSALSYLLDKSDDWFLNPDRNTSHPITPARRAWSVRLFAKSLLFASLYPILMMFYQWLLMDEQVRFGRSTLLHDTDTLGKLLVIFTYFASFVTALLALWEPVSTRRRWSLTSVGFALIALVLLGLIFGPPDPDVPLLTENWFLGTAATSVLIAFVLLCHFNAINLLVGPAMGIVIGGSIVALLSPNIESIAEQIADGDAGKRIFFDGLLSVLLNLFVAILISIPLTIFLSIIIDKKGYITPTVYAAIPCFAVGLMAYGAGYLDNPSYFIVLGLIPVINAVFDFGSIGLTRWALRSGLTDVGARTIGFSAFDLIAALILFLMLGCFCIFIFHVVNTIALGVPGSTGVAVVNLYQSGNIFHQMAGDPAAYSWLYLTFLTTLIPTVLHASVAVWAIGPAVLSESFRLRLANRFVEPPRTVVDQIVSVVPLAAWSTLAVFVPVILIVTGYYAISDSSCQVGFELLNVFIRFLQVVTNGENTIGLLDITDLCVKI